MLFIYIFIWIASITHTYTDLLSTVTSLEGEELIRLRSILGLRSAFVAEVENPNAQKAAGA